MRFYDASAVVKRYYAEADAGLVEALFGDDGPAAICRLTEVEVTAAFARRHRDGAVTAAERDALIAAFADDLPGFAVVEITPDVARIARRLVVQHALKSSDAIQLAAALLVGTQTGRAVRFATFDRRLARVASVEGGWVEPVLG